MEDLKKTLICLTLHCLINGSIQKTHDPDRSHFKAENKPEQSYDYTMLVQMKGPAFFKSLPLQIQRTNKTNRHKAKAASPLIRLNKSLIDIHVFKKKKLNSFVNSTVSAGDGRQSSIFYFIFFLL